MRSRGSCTNGMSPLHTATTLLHTLDSCRTGNYRCPGVKVMGGVQGSGTFVDSQVAADIDCTKRQVPLTERCVDFDVMAHACAVCRFCDGSSFGQFAVRHD